MEKMKSAENDLLKSIFTIAKTLDSKPIKPARLLNKISEYKEPCSIFNDQNESDFCLEVLLQDFPELKKLRSYKTDLSDADLENLSRFLLWIKNQLVNWKQEDDPAFIMLCTLIISIYMIDSNGSFWLLVSNEFNDLPNFSKILEKLISSMHCKFNVKFPNLKSSIWESEAIEEFVKADEENDLQSISDLLNKMKDIRYPNIFLNQAVKYFNQFDLSNLVNILDGFNRFQEIIIIAASLSGSEKLYIAEKSSNIKVKFICFYERFSEWKQFDPLNDKEKNCVLNILSYISSNNQEWINWMQVFNKFPSRYLGLQPILGQVLAQSSNEAIENYISTIPLSIYLGINRETITECFKSFQQFADKDKQLFMWKTAYSTWAIWNFEQSKNTHLVEITFSEIDYAIVSYIVECLDKDECASMTNHILEEELKSIDTEWHQSETDFLCYKNRILSKLQPFMHAQSLTTCQNDLLQTNRLYLPQEWLENEYFSLKYLNDLKRLLKVTQH